MAAATKRRDEKHRYEQQRGRSIHTLVCFGNSSFAIKLRFPVFQVDILQDGHTLTA